MWTYTNGTVAKNAFDTPEIEKIAAINDGSKSYSAKYLLINDTVKIVENGQALVEGVEIGGVFHSASTVALNGDTIVNNHFVVFNPATGKPLATFGQKVAQPSDKLVIDGVETPVTGDVFIKDYLSQIKGGFRLTTAGIVAVDKKTGKTVVEEAEVHQISDANSCKYETKIDLNTASPQYNAAGDWVGILFAVQAIGSVLWAIVLPRFRSRKFSYSLSLVLGAVGFVLAGLIQNQYMLFIAFFLIGCAWAAMLAWPFTILTNSLKGGNIGAYLGLFNCSICLPQIIGALAGGYLSISALTNLSRQIMNVRGQFQQLEISFSTMLGSEEKAIALMGQLVETAAKTPFDLQSISQGAKQLLAYGEASETVNDTLVRLGNIASG
ncbi:MAG: MFS transporter, partial [Muribaculaceae bacterium]|nr:MFS transporter [Muribaculaceae bacterium]